MTKPISLASRHLDQTIGDLTSALGDPTRRAIFIAVRESAAPVTSSEVAELFSIHANVARHHLDKLAGDGYLTVSMQRRTGRSGPGAGRPAKCYEVSDKPIDLHFPSRRQDLLVTLLLRIIGRAAEGDVASVAERVGYEYGRDLAEQIGTPDNTEYAAAVTAVAKAMTGIGFHMSPDLEAGTLLTSRCPFGDAASDHPDVVCSLDRGIVSGLFGSIGPLNQPVLHPHSSPIDACVTEVPLTIVSRA